MHLRVLADKTHWPATPRNVFAVDMTDTDGTVDLPGLTPTRPSAGF